MLKQIITISLLFSGAINSVNAEIYKWTDEQGNVHYGDKPVVDSTEMEINISKKSNGKISQSREESRQKLLDAYDEDNKREAQEKDKLKKQKKKQKKNCTYAKDRLRHYERARSLYDLDKEGNRVTMSNADREKVTSDLRNKIKKFCK